MRGVEAAFRPNTKCVFGETIANPALAVLDIERFVKAAHAHGVPLIVDNTFPTPVNCNPIKWGANIVTHSTLSIWMVTVRAWAAALLMQARLTGWRMLTSLQPPDSG